MSTRAFDRPLRFALAGAFGFVIELTVVGLLTAQGWTPLSARAISFPSATLLTWMLNRRLVFANVRALNWQDMLGEYKRYFIGQLAGALSNLLFYTLLVLGLPSIGPLWALSVGAFFGLLVNYHIAGTWVFRGRHDGH